MGLRVKTKSIWRFPNPSYFKFLDEIIRKGLPKTICILGCSDGKFVIHAAKRGFQILAIDLDRVGLYGGEAIVDSKKLQVVGLSQRLKIEEVEESVKLVYGDFLSYKPNKTFSGLFTSGSIHYAENSKYSMNHVIKKIKSYVSINGILFFEYIHRSNIDNDSNRHFITKEQMTSYFNNPSWTIIKHTRHTHIEKPNPRNPWIHKIVWGKLRVVKNS